MGCLETGLASLSLSCVWCEQAVSDPVDVSSVPKQQEGMTVTLILPMSIVKKCIFELYHT